MMLSWQYLWKVLKIPAATPLHIWWLRSWSHMSPQNLFCFITYLLEGEQELSLGILIRPKRIYNFWCSMLALHQLLWVSLLFCGIFIWFLALTYWQDATVPVPCFLLFLVSEKLFWKYSQNWMPRRQKSLFFQHVAGVRRRPGGSQWAGLTMPRHGPTPGRA